jgi:hypothetical protein
MEWQCSCSLLGNRIVIGVWNITKECFTDIKSPCIKPSPDQANSWERHKREQTVVLQSRWDPISQSSVGCMMSQRKPVRTLMSGWIYAKLGNVSYRKSRAQTERQRTLNALCCLSEVISSGMSRRTTCPGPGLPHCRNSWSGTWYDEHGGQRRHFHLTSKQSKYIESCAVYPRYWEHC